MNDLLQNHMGPSSASSAAERSGSGQLPPSGGSSSALVTEDGIPVTPRAGATANQAAGGGVVVGGTASTASSAASPIPFDSMCIEMMQLSTVLLRYGPRELLKPHRQKLVSLSWKYTKVSCFLTRELCFISQLSFLPVFAFFRTKT